MPTIDTPVQVTHINIGTQNWAEMEAEKMHLEYVNWALQVLYIKSCIFKFRLLIFEVF